MDARNELAEGFVAAIGDGLTMLIVGFLALAMFLYVLFRLLTHKRRASNRATSDVGDGGAGREFDFDADGE